MVKNLLYVTSMKVLQYAKENSVSIDKSLAHFSLAHDYLRRNRVKIYSEYEEGQLSEAQYLEYTSLYDEIRNGVKRKEPVNRVGYVRAEHPDYISIGPSETTITVSNGPYDAYALPPGTAVTKDLLYRTPIREVEEPKEETRGSRTWETRDSKGRIISYGYRISSRGTSPLEGELSRAQMEQIYSLYPYNTLETVSSQFAFLTAEDLGRIARAFGIKKTKKVPKHIIEESPEEKIAEFEVNAKMKHVSKKMEVHKSAILERNNKFLQEELEYYRRAEEWAESVVERYFNRTKSEVTVRTIITEGVLDKPMGVNTYAMFSDIHFGKLFPSTKIRYGRGTDKHILRERCHRIARQTVKKAIANGSPEVHMICAGDLFESIVPGGMHQGQVMDMEGDEQVDFALDVFDEMFGILQAGLHMDVVIKLHGIGGNHDRIQQKREEDRKRTGTLLFYRMLHRINNLRYANSPRKIEIHTDYEDGIITFAADNEGLSFLGHHGDSPLAKKAAEKQINMHKTGYARNFTVLFQGHMHSHKCLDEGPNYVYLQLAAVTSGDGYSQNQLSEGAQPSFIIGNRAEDNAFGFDFTKYTLA